MVFSSRPDPKRAGIVEHPVADEDFQQCARLALMSELTNLLRRSRLSNSQTYAQNGIGTKIRLIFGPVKLNEKFINLGLVLDIKILLDELGANSVVNILHGFQDTFSAPF